MTDPRAATGASRRDARWLLATCVAAAARAAEVIREARPRLAAIDWQSKGQADFVSEVDHAAEAALTEVIAGRHPDATLLAEERSPDADAAAGLVFVADPLDGTTNFLHGYPWYAVSIAACLEGVPVAGVVLNAATGELFSATAGGGARRGGEPIRVSSIADPSRALLGTGLPFKHREGFAHTLRLLPGIMERTAGIRRAGAAALDLADVACGRFDAFWELRLAPWDVAAGILLVREAGGLVTDLEGHDAPVASGPIVAGNPDMHRWLLQHLKDTA